MLRPTISRFTFVILTSIYILALCNMTFWAKAWNYSSQDTLFLVGMAIFLLFTLNALIGSFAYKYALKPVAIIFVIVAGTSAYFADTFGTIIDRSMINNALATDQAEAGELLTASFFIHMGLYVILPVALLLWIKIKFNNFKKTYFQNVAFVSACLVVVVAIVLPNFSGYASIARNHRDLVKNLHPSQPMFALLQVASRNFIEKDMPLVSIGADAHFDVDIAEHGEKKPKLTIMVLGETARAKSFSLNGYERETNPKLKKHDVFNFENVKSCGTATAVSVPCMFSHFGKGGFSGGEAKYTENVLDIITKAGVHTAWFNNNSGSKGQADRIHYVNLKVSADPKYCSEDGCFDEILIEEMRNYVDTLDIKDTLIVLHQLGSHGPSYYKRVPQSFKKFFPECATAELNKCSQEEIINAYDNTILYTDYVLAKIIDYLKSKADNYDTSMLYVSDHGESTGEYGLYLHGLPYALAPDEQVNVPFIAWMSDAIIRQEEINRECMHAMAKLPLSHDNFFHTLLELVEVDTEEYNPKLDVFYECGDDSQDIEQGIEDDRSHG